MSTVFPQIMPTESSALTQIEDFVRRHLLALLLACYALGALFPHLGLALRDLNVGALPGTNGSLRASLPVLLLGILLLCSGLLAKRADFETLRNRPVLPLAGITVNVLLPLAYAAFISIGLRSWHSHEELQNLLVGLALVGAMPIAGSSTAWAQNAGGNLALSLALVVGSTLAGPLLTPLALHSVAYLTEGDYAEDLREIATQAGSVFLLLSVVLPSALGALIQFGVGEARLARLRPVFKLASSGALLLLNYVNAASALPQVIRQPDWDFLALILAITAALCALAFYAGWGLARTLKASSDETASLMYGLGMNNNGGGMVLASMALADHPLVLLPLLLYNLVQQVAAGLVGLILRGLSKRPESQRS